MQIETTITLSIKLAPTDNNRRRWEAKLPRLLEKAFPLKVDQSRLRTLVLAELAKVQYPHLNYSDFLHLGGIVTVKLYRTSHPITCEEIWMPILMSSSIPMPTTVDEAEVVGG